MGPFPSRCACRWSTAVSLLTLLCLIGPWLGASASGEATSKRAKGLKARANKAMATQASASPGEPNLSNIPLAVGHEAKGLVLPDFDGQGRLRGKFVAGEARRIDQDHVGLQDLKITTFTEQNQIDLEIAMQTSVLDLKTRILSSSNRTTVWRSDFNLVGDSAVFDADNRTARVIGNVKMVISGKSSLIEKFNQ